MFTNLLTILILSVPITFWDYGFCPDKMWEHHLIIIDDVIQENHIKICNEIEDVIFVVVHELWHQFWSLHLSVYEREQYRALQTDSILDYHREYWMSEPIEDFADNFANIILGRVNPNGTENYRKKIEFIENIISKYE